MRSKRLMIALASTGLVVAACGSGRPASEAGFERVVAPPATGDAGPGADADAPGSSGDSSAGVAGSNGGAVDAGQDRDSDGGSDPATNSTEKNGTETNSTETNGTVAPTATAPDLADLPPCPVDALDARDPSDGPVEVTMWFGLAGDLPGVLHDLTDEYNASQDRVVVRGQNQVDYESVVDKFVQFGIDERPELVLAPEYIVQTFAQSGLFIPVESCMQATGYDSSTFLPGVIGAYRVGGTQWGLPFNASNPVMFYNRNLFEAAGLDPDDPPLSFDEVRAVSQQLVDSGAAGFGLVVDSSRDSGLGGTSFEQWFGRVRVPFADNGNGRLAPATQVLFDDENGLGFLTFLRDMVADGLAVSVGENAGGQAGLFKLVDEEAPAAMAIETSSAIGTVLAALSGGLIAGFDGGDLGVAFMPGPSDFPAAQIGGGSLWIPSGKSDTEAAAAWDFIQFLTAAQTQSTWAEGTGYIPVRSDAIELDPFAATIVADPRYRVAYDQLLGVDDDILATRPLLGPQREVRQEIADALATIYDDPSGADLETILAEAAAASDALIANYNALN